MPGKIEKEKKERFAGGKMYSRHGAKQKIRSEGTNRSQARSRDQLYSNEYIDKFRDA